MYDKQNYAKYLSITVRFPHTHPDIHQHMLQGGFSVQMGPTNTFGRLPVAQIIEESINKDTPPLVSTVKDMDKPIWSESFWAN